ncbi:MAG TPA: hypothetical protein VKC54_02760 [Patescibacteria group bacterium]|nr:hypothetical protein [Patescibacteria group bacterium]
MIASFVAEFSGILIFLFIFWKRLKEDYSSEIIFRTASFVLTGILISWLISLRFYPPAFLWFEFLGALAGLSVASFTLRLRFYETLEALIVASLPWLSFLFLKDSVTESSLISFFVFLAVLVFIFVFYYLDIHYKRFSWYKSGKIGFSGLATIGLIFAVRSAIALSGITVISFLSRIEAYVSGIAAILAFTLLFNLGRQKK